jgi:hypothetical protein
MKLRDNINTFSINGGKNGDIDSIGTKFGHHSEGDAQRWERERGC